MDTLAFTLVHCQWPVGAEYRVPTVEVTNPLGIQYDVVEYEWHEVDNPPPLQDIPMSTFAVKMTDEIAIGCYSQAEFIEIRDYLFGLAAQGLAKWYTERDNAACWTTYSGQGTQDTVQLFIAFVRGEAIRFMTMKGWR